MMNFRGIIKQAWKTLVKGDASAYPQGQSQYNDKTTDFIRLSTYGICANAPEGSHVFLIGSQGMESTKFGIENDFLKRLKGLKSGEVALYNTLTGSYVFLKENGDADLVATGKVNVESPSEINLTAPVINLNGNVVASGTVTATDFKAGGLPDYSAHKHNDPVSGQTSGPV